jgi:FAD/FMN-containing dehydrogenase
MTDDKGPAQRGFRSRRRVLAGAVGLGAAALAARQVYRWGAPPDGEKLCDFAYPAPPPNDGLTEAAPGLEFTQRGGTINDASCLNRTPVLGIAAPRSIDDVRAALSYARAGGYKVTAAGTRHSMGGQSFHRGGLVLDMRALDRIDLDLANRTIVVGAGVKWSSLLQYLDEHGLSVKAMQSVSAFTVGGTLSVNAHGIAHTPGCVAHTVRFLDVMLANGEVIKASPQENGELFRHVLGGYGLFGVILEAQLDVVANDVYRPAVAYIDYREFPEYFAQNIEPNPEIGLMYARLSVSPSKWLQETAVHVYLRDGGPEHAERLEPDSHTRLKRTVFNLSKTGAVGRWIRWQAERNFEARLECTARNEAIGHDPACRVSRNQEMDDPMTYVQGRLDDTDILQEYFVPRAGFAAFVEGLREVVAREGANLLNVTVRSVEADSLTALPYAPHGAFALVLYFNQALNAEACRIVERTTVALVDLALSLGGRFYLPYQLYYSPAQLQAAYPEASAFFAAKAKYDPDGIFSNTFYEKYGRTMSVAGG